MPNNQPRKFVLSMNEVLSRMFFTYFQILCVCRSGGGLANAEI